jgi:hypothetical protein
MARADNVQAMRDVAAALAKVPRRGCARDPEQRIMSRGSD